MYCSLVPRARQQKILMSSPALAEGYDTPAQQRKYSTTFVQSVMVRNQSAVQSVSSGRLSQQWTTFVQSVSSGRQSPGSSTQPSYPCGLGHWHWHFKISSHLSSAFKLMPSMIMITIRRSKRNTTVSHVVRTPSHGQQRSAGKTRRLRP